MQQTSRTLLSTYYRLAVATGLRADAASLAGPTSRGFATIVDENVPRGPFPPFTAESARQKVKAAEDAWNTRDPAKVAQAYTVDSDWRNRTDFFVGRPKIRKFLTKKWEKELDYRLMKELWAYTGDKIAVRFEYEWHDASGQWYRTHGNELWHYTAEGLMKRRDMSANDYPIQESERRYRWART